MGCTSGNFFVEIVNFLQHLLHGDMVKSDRGSLLQSVTLKKATHQKKLTKSKSQPDPMDVEKTRGIASARIHVERVTGLFRWEYAILESTLPTDSLVCSPHGPPNGQVPIMDGFVRVCSALVNGCFTVVQFD